MWKPKFHYRVHASQPIVPSWARLIQSTPSLSVSWRTIPYLLSVTAYSVYICNYPPYLEGVSSICHIGYLAVLLQIYQGFHDKLLKPFVVEGSLTENCYIVCTKFRWKEVSFKVTLILWVQYDGAAARFCRQVTEQLNCWYGWMPLYWSNFHIHGTLTLISTSTVIFLYMSAD